MAERADRADQPLRHRKARDRAVILPLVGAILFLPPMAAIFRLDAAIGGVPLPVVYLFAVWAGLIAAAAALAPRLRESDAAVEDAGGVGESAPRAAPDGKSGGTPADGP